LRRRPSLRETRGGGHHRRHRLGRLDRDRAHPRREGGDIKPILPGRAPVPPQWKMTVLNRRRLCFRAIAKLVLHIGAAVDLRVPEGGGAFGRDAARHHLMQAAEHDVGQHVPDRVPRRDGARAVDIEQAARRSAGGDRRQRAGIVRAPRAPPGI